MVSQQKRDSKCKLFDEKLAKSAVAFPYNGSPVWLHDQKKGSKVMTHSLQSDKDPLNLSMWF